MTGKYTELFSLLASFVEGKLSFMPGFGLGDDSFELAVGEND